jgi:hypothetical protein
MQRTTFITEQAYFITPACQAQGKSAENGERMDAD